MRGAVAMAVASPVADAAGAGGEWPRQELAATA